MGFRYVEPSKSPARYYLKWKRLFNTCFALASGILLQGGL